MYTYETLIDGTIAKIINTEKGASREMFTPNLDIASLPDDIAKIATTAWTKEVVNAYNQKCNSSPFDWLKNG